MARHVAEAPPEAPTSFALGPTWVRVGLWVTRGAALLCALVFGIGWQWFAGLAAPSATVRRVGDDLRALTVLGPRCVRLPRAFIVRFRIWSGVGTTHGLFVLDRRCRALVVLSPVGPADTGRTRALVPAAEDSLWRAACKHLLGLGRLLATVVVVFVLGGALGAAFSVPGSGLG
ncbi:hypothetical protein [Curtobacterium oceanosedimentum]|uniref:hypothetical protein n=1 Tax=Curtobacterium oceanosedimentum TaxID=465820 RepID=UPI003395067B